MTKISSAPSATAITQNLNKVCERIFKLNTEKKKEKIEDRPFVHMQ